MSKLKIVIYSSHQAVKHKCDKAIKLIKVMKKKKTLLKLYPTLMCIKIDYGCLNYGSARNAT